MSRESGEAAAATGELWVVIDREQVGLEGVGEVLCGFEAEDAAAQFCELAEREVSNLDDEQLEVERIEIFTDAAGALRSYMDARGTESALEGS